MCLALVGCSVNGGSGYHSLLPSLISLPQDPKFLAGPFLLATEAHYSKWKQLERMGVGTGEGRGGDSLSDCRPTLKVSWGILAIATGAPITLP